MSEYGGKDFRREVREFFADESGKRKRGLRQKRKGRNLGGAKAVKR